MKTVPLALILCTTSILPVNAALISHYTFENSGNLGLDTTGNANTNTSIGAPSQSTTNLPGNGTGSGALQLNGTSSLAADNNFTADLSVYTVSLWVKIDNPLIGGTQSIISTRESAGGLLLWAGGGNGTDTNSNFRLNHYSNDGNSNQNRQLQSGVEVTNTWTHVAVTYDGTTARFYINGVAGTTSTDMALGAGSSDDIGIGMRSPSNTGNTMSAGQLDDVGIWDNALSASEIQNIYDNGVGSYVPEPSSALLLGLGGLSLLIKRRR